ncbi:hypothetical protein [Sphingobium yanoikuyae]|nr:hypothetical protein [Sphingobium yanoikuyae]
MPCFSVTLNSDRMALSGVLGGRIVPSARGTGMVAVAIGHPVRIRARAAA